MNPILPESLIGGRFKRIGWAAFEEYRRATGKIDVGIDWVEYRPGRWACLIANFANEPSTFLSLDRPKELLFSDEALAVSRPARINLRSSSLTLGWRSSGW